MFLLASPLCSFGDPRSFDIDVRKSTACMPFPKTYTEQSIGCSFDVNGKVTPLLCAFEVDTFCVTLFGLGRTMINRVDINHPLDCFGLGLKVAWRLGDVFGF